MAKAKKVKGIDCDAAASAGIKLVLTTRFGELHSWRDAALNWDDPEGVHSMRVASRRLRSALRDFMPYLRKQSLTPVLKQLKTIADALGEVRDQDVALVALEKIATQAPADFSTALPKVIDTRKEVRNEARKKLKAVLQKAQLKQLAKDFTAAVEEATANASRQTTFAQMSQAVIPDRLKELEKLSDGLYRPFDVEPLHEIRIAAKRLRYALELFQQCWGNSLGTYAKRAARIQTALGDLHDCDVWIESLDQHISAARKQKEHDRVAAYLWLLSHLTKLRTKHLRQAYTRWSEWELHDVSGKLRETLPSAFSASPAHREHG